MGEMWMEWTEGKHYVQIHSYVVAAELDKRRQKMKNVAEIQLNDINARIPSENGCVYTIENMAATFPSLSNIQLIVC